MDKSRDYLLQMSPITVWFMRKPSQGDAVFHTMSVTVFKAAAKQVDYVVKSGSHRRLQGNTQVETASFNLWRLVLATAGVSGKPCVGDKLYGDGEFWIVTEVEYLDRDQSGTEQRYRVTCDKSTGTPEA